MGQKEIIEVEFKRLLPNGIKVTENLQMDVDLNEDYKKRSIEYTWNRFNNRCNEKALLPILTIDSSTF